MTEPAVPTIAALASSASASTFRTDDETIYPFAALVGQASMKLALTLAAIHPGLGGVLIRGSKRAAKSTAVRALAALLPDVDVVPDDPFRRAPGEALPDWPLPEGSEFARRPVALVNLPVGATDDRVVGSLNFERALTTGRRRFEPGLLAAAHRGLLYIDEANLLGDHLVDVLLDAAAMGVNHIKREGLAFRHPARFAPVGTMNPEEGEPRPRVLDRRGVFVRSRPPIGRVFDPALTATLRAATPWQLGRGRTDADQPLHLRPDELRDKVRARRTQHLILFVVDASRSMGARRRMALTKGAVLSLLIDAYQKQERVGQISFHGTPATPYLTPIRSVKFAAKRLGVLPVGGLRRSPIGSHWPNGPSPPSAAASPASPPWWCCSPTAAATSRSSRRETRKPTPWP